MDSSPLHQQQPVPAVEEDCTHKAPIQTLWKLAQWSNQTGLGFSDATPAPVIAAGTSLSAFSDLENE